MEKLLNFDDIALIPALLNNGTTGQDKNDYGVLDTDGVVSLPIFTSPVDSILNMTNWRDWEKAGIKPVLPRTLPLEQRLEGCQYIFAAFSKKEVEENFLARGKRASQYQFHICIDPGNGHDIAILQLSQRLKQIYSGQVNIMAGNIGNAKVYPDYCKAGIDYVRVGMSTGSLVVPDKYGFYTPLASMLIDITALKNTACVGLKLTKVVADGGVYSHSDIIKAMALGADFVMCGRAFVKLLEAAGTLYRKIKTPEGKDILEAVSPDIAKTGVSFKELGLKRAYYGNTTLEMQEVREGKGSKQPHFIDSSMDWVEVTGTLDNWINKLYDVFNYGFMMANAKNWTEFRNNIRYGRIQ
jgi:GMP reductase